ncbi:anti-sigma factor [Croceibacterium ferulae]|uniref:anti-sigma factor n=1 Tax=Croceibacterium ferulae TaxID=1854641 RepID=UPI000EB13A4A|nr:anti-sigma factor [Croceibacterium ferulae]
MNSDDQILAAELALGLLDDAEHMAARQRLLTDPDFAAEVAWWQDRFAGLAEGTAAVEPPSALLARIQARLTQAAPAGAARRWNWFTGGALTGALAASLAALLLMPDAKVIERVRERVVEIPVAAPAPLVAVLAPGEGTGREPVAAVYDQQTRTLRLTATITVPADRAAELWSIGSDNVPRPLGLLTAGTRGAIRIEGDMVLQPDETIAISIEPVGGSPTGQPTGEVIAAGPLVTS